MKKKKLLKVLQSSEFISEHVALSEEIFSGMTTKEAFENLRNTILQLVIEIIDDTDCAEFLLKHDNRFSEAVHCLSKGDNFVHVDQITSFHLANALLFQMIEDELEKLFPDLM